jgi:hypothetical protein
VGLRAAGIEHDHARRTVEVRLGLAGAPREAGVLAEGLAEAIDEAAGDHGLVAGLAGGEAADRDVVAVDRDLAALDVRRGDHLGGVEARLVEGVVELDLERRAGRTVATPAALGVDDLERRVGVEAEALAIGGAVGALGRRRARTDRHLDVGVLGERLGGGEGQPAAVLFGGLGGHDQALHGLVALDLIGGEEPGRVGLARGLDGHGGQDRRRIDPLIEPDEHRLVELLRPAARPARLDARRRRRERELLGRRQDVAGGRPGAGRDLDGVGGGLGEADDRVEEDGLRAEPTPAPGRRRGQLDRHDRGGVVLRGDGHHRLREGELELRRQGHVAFGRPAQDRERLAGVVGRRRWAGLGVGRREGALHGLAGARRRGRAIAEREGLGVVGLGRDRRDPIEERPGRGGVEGLGRRQGAAIGGGGAALAVGQPHGEARLLVVEDQRGAAGDGGLAGAAAGAGPRLGATRGRDEGRQRDEGEAADREATAHGCSWEIATSNA